MKDIRYPIYNFSLKWSENGEQRTDYPKWHEGLVEGRIWNSTSYRKMFKEEKTQGWLDSFIMDRWNKLISSDKYWDKDVKLLYLKAEFFEKESWVISWFQHETFDIGQTDKEALESFQDFVWRREDDESYCLMGAEDRWRWHGAEPDGEPTYHSPAPCRCKFCKKDGLIRIAH